MFTGIIEHVGRIAAIAHGLGGTRLRVDLGPLAADAKLGDSIAVSGACLTIAQLEGSTAHFDVSEETRRKTTIGGWQEGRKVNLERALAFGQRLGGHLVAGHVDAVGRLAERRVDRTSERFTITLPDGGAVRVVEKGSLSVDGVSLTTWDCRGARCSIAVIPHTLANTTLGELRAGMPVNLEQDLIGRWVEAMVAPPAKP
ncbi:MAG: riboflavin synthase [Planctomycetes bacterium]|nr:riboflavin synthase [Planctomycetota bacterium]